MNFYSVAIPILLALAGEPSFGQSGSLAKGRERQIVFCDLWVTATSPTQFPASGGNGSFSASSGCAWTITKPDWVTITSANAGPGENIPVLYSVAANPGGARSGTITFASTQGVDSMGIVISQDGNGPNPCSYSFSPQQANAPQTAGQGTVNVIAPAGCAWTATSTASWLTITSGASGSGNGTIVYSYEANTSVGVTRSATLTTHNQTFTLTQAGCQLVSLNPTSQNVSSAAGGGTANVTAAAGCAWTAVSNVNWITVLSGATGTGNGAVGFSFQQNPNTTPRSGTMTIGGQTFSLNQEAASSTCDCSLSSASGSLSANGGTLNVSLTTGVTCPWSVVVPSVGWVEFQSPLNGTGLATITFTVLANPSANSRNTTFTVAGRTFSISQAGASGSGQTAGLRLVTLEPCRVLETRPEYNYQGRTGPFGPPYMRANETRTLNLPASTVCQIPAAAKAYLLNVTVIPRNTGVDFLTVYPTGEGRPLFWTVRSPDRQIVANSAIVKAGTGGGIDVFASTDTDAIIDVSGYYTDNPNVSNLVYYPLTPCRVIDTRTEYRMPPGPFGPPTLNAREPRRFRFPASPYCQVPEGAAAYSFTITVVPPGPLMFITAWPSGGAHPNVSSINSPAGRILANSVVMPVASDGSIDVYAYDRTDFLVDINGYYAPDDGVNGLLYFPVPQCRAADSTSSLLPSPFGGPICESRTWRSLAIPSSPACSSIPTNAKAFAVNVTALPNGAPMPFITAYPTGQERPTASILNAFQGQIVTNSAIVPAGPNGSIDIYTYTRTHVVVEISGYFGR